jgi:catechol-2,3-dioxygenase
MVPDHRFQAAVSYSCPAPGAKLNHTTFTTLRMEQMVTCYGLVCGLRPVFQSDEASWLTNDEANHRIALLSPPGLKHPSDKGHETGIHHTAFEFSTFDMWLNNYIRLRDHQVLPFLTLDHGITMSVYYQDPDGNGVEIQVDGFGDWADSSEWIANAKEIAANPIGTFFDPEKLVAAREQGLEFQEIHERAPRRRLPPRSHPQRYLPARSLVTDLQPRTRGTVTDDRNRPSLTALGGRGLSAR